MSIRVLYDVSTSQINVVFLDERPEGGNVDKRFRTSAGVSLYDVSTSKINVVFLDERQEPGNVDKCFGTSAGVFITFLYMLGCYDLGHQHLSDPG